ncbi:MAG: hypothetical protein PVI28_19815, partial [Gammaproteobacteria bacterium]
LFTNTGDVAIGHFSPLVTPAFGVWRAQGSHGGSLTRRSMNQITRVDFSLRKCNIISRQQSKAG